ncbi:TonB-dependent receptor [Brevundimonas sp.]|uniref:TonB-dependent receptor n=1 Tax=Brevundimonas sp. TaxID=1871086 RepID=UPI002FD95B24
MRRANLLRCTVSAAVVGAVAFGFAGAAAAQDGPTTVDDIIVTAQKREQSLQDVPIVVTSLSQEVLQDAGVKDIKDLTILTPGMTVTSTTTEASTTARIRGVGTVGDNPGLESSVGVVVDGVYRSRNGVGFGDLGEMARIEVLKGPQGTLFGKNTSAGVINIITEAPSFTPSWNLEATAGNYDAWGLSGSVTGPITDEIAMRLYAARRERNGFYDVDVGAGPRTLTDDANQEFYTLRGQLLFLPNDAASIRVIADYTRRTEYCCAAVQVRTGPTYPFIDGAATGTGQRPPAPGNGALPFSRQAFSNRDTGQEIIDRGISAEANIDVDWFGGSTLTSVTSFRDWSTTNGMDLDFTSADIAYRNQDGEFRSSLDSLTQEFRLAGANDRLDWLVGVFANRENVTRRDSFYFGAAYAPVLSYQLSASLNAATAGAIPISPSIIPCFTRTAQTTLGLQQCLGTGGAIMGGGPSFAAGQSLRDNYAQASESVALFTNNTFHLTDAFDITVGLRYTYDSKRLDSLQTNVGTNGLTCAAGLANQGAIVGAVGATNAPAILGRLCLPWSNPFYANRARSEEVNDSEVSGTVKASYRLNDSIMVYASYARGYKSFGFNMDRVQSGVTPNASLYFPSEIADSYEAGIKTTLFDRTVLLNATYFDQTFSDFQLNTFLGTAFVVESIPELTARGVDADFMWFTPIEGLSFAGGVTYTDAKYGKFTAADLFNPANFNQLSLLPGNRSSFAPEWSGTASINFDREIGGGLRAGFALSAKYMTEYNTGSDLLPFKMQDAFTTVNGRISIGAADDRWTLDLWGQNLTDEDYVQVAFNGFLQGSAFNGPLNTAPGPYQGSYYNPSLDSQTYAAFLGQPRTYGFTLRFKH